MVSSIGGRSYEDAWAVDTSLSLREPTDRSSTEPFPIVVQAEFGMTQVSFMESDHPLAV